MTDPVVGIDIGGTKTAAALVGPDARVLGRREVPTPRAAARPRCSTPPPAWPRTCSLPPAPGRSGWAPRAPSTRDRRHPVRHRQPARMGRHPVADELAARLGRPVRVTNDVAAAALGECWAGAGRGRGHVLLAAVGTGLGGAIVNDGRVEGGARARPASSGTCRSRACTGCAAAAAGTGT
ncbi:ROK family protein [Micromonospora sp. BRA006-A]|nr:ROK family protein [Micromonospora sp. BRA006-A]